MPVVHQQWQRLVRQCSLREEPEGSSQGDTEQSRLEQKQLAQSWLHFFLVSGYMLHYQERDGRGHDLGSAAISF